MLTGHSVQVMLGHYQQVTNYVRRAASEQAGLGILEDPDDTEAWLRVASARGRGPSRRKQPLPSDAGQDRTQP